MAGRRAELSAAVQALAPVANVAPLQRQIPVETEQPRRAMPPEVRERLRGLLSGLRSRRPSFETWTAQITQRTVDIIALLEAGVEEGGTLARLRFHGVIDEHDKLVPIEERAARHEANEARVKAEREAVERELAEHGIIGREPGSDDA